MGKKALLVMSHGGHTKEMLLLDEKIKSKVDTSYLILSEDQFIPQKRGKKIFRIFGARTRDSGFIHDIFGTFAMIIQSIWILIKTKPDAIISCGTSSAVPISYIGKILGKKIIFIESMSRIYHHSLSGRLIYPIADLFFVQWKTMKKVYPKAIYAGRLR